MDKSFSISNRMSELARVVSNSTVTSASQSPVGLETGIEIICARLLDLKNAARHLFIVGNGGSAAVASHAVTDFFNVAKLKALTLHESSLTTCMANDYGYENAFSRLIEQMASEGDMLIAISSSGRSPNVCNAVLAAKRNGGYVFTMSGFNADNPLRKLGDLNLWLDSGDYGLVEIGHQSILHNISDRFGCGILGQA